MKHLVYLSKATQNFSQTDLLELLNKSRSNNAKKGITGAMIYSAGNFMQFLEGEESEVDALFQAISKDKRHTNVETLMDEPCHKLFYRSWSMAYFNVNQNRQVSPMFSQRISRVLATKQPSASSVVSLFNEFRNYLVA